jgi:hypothetical protein
MFGSDFENENFAFIDSSLLRDAANALYSLFILLMFQMERTEKANTEIKDIFATAFLKFSFIKNAVANRSAAAQTKSMSRKKLEGEEKPSMNLSVTSIEP